MAPWPLGPGDYYLIASAIIIAIITRAKVGYFEILDIGKSSIDYCYSPRCPDTLRYSQTQYCRSNDDS
jgi:hypothetical protein